jgi:hypothetical protein
VLVAIVRKRLGLEISLYQILQVLSVTLFEKTPILQAIQATRLPTGFTQLRQPIDSVRLIAGQLVRKVLNRLDKSQWKASHW